MRPHPQSWKCLDVLAGKWLSTRPPHPTATRVQGAAHGFSGCLGRSPGNGAKRKRRPPGVTRRMRPGTQQPRSDKPPGRRAQAGAGGPHGLTPESHETSLRRRPGAGAPTARCTSLRRDGAWVSEGVGRVGRQHVGRGLRPQEAGRGRCRTWGWGSLICAVGGPGTEWPRRPSGFPSLVVFPG